MMRFFCVLGLLVLASPVSQAGMVIDDFTAPVIGGGTRTTSGFFNPASPSTSGSYQVTNDVYSTLSYSFATPQNLLANNIISLTDFTSDGSGFVTATVNGQIYQPESFINGGDLTFVINSGALSNLSTLSFKFETDPFAVDQIRNFGFSSVQAVPEPTSIALVGLAGLGGFVARRRRKVSQVAAV